ncbi:MAG: Gfo/Idh/MocA family oxidoreductase [Deltaproteobacteria bacterium]|nr:Gfo/Idh/MocA family oxidoreductase [Deltaproteobacteria bacterium]
MKGILIGFGNMGQTHWERYQHLGVGLLAVVEVDETKTKLAQAKGLRVYPSLSKVSKVQEANFIDICTPTHPHFQHIEEAMRFEKPIFVEKPIVRLPEEAQKLRRINYPFPIFVGEVEHYNPKLKPFLDYTGKPQTISIRREVNLDFFLEGTAPWFLDEKLSGGIVLDTMIHDINLLVAKYGKPSIKKVQCQKKRYPCVDAIEATLAFNSFEANLFTTWAAPKGESPITTSIKIHEKNGQTIETGCDDYIIRGKPLSQDAFYLELKAFLKSIQSGKTPYALSVYLEAFGVVQEIIQFSLEN